MPAMDNVAARLTVLETVLRQLVTHLAIRTDDPPGWVRTRKVLALTAIESAHAGPGPDEMAPMRSAVSELFDELESVAADYACDNQGTPQFRPR